MSRPQRSAFRALLSLVAAIAALAAAVSAAACASNGLYSASFVRYETLQDGTAIAVVSPVQEPDELQNAYCGIRNLRAGEKVRVRWEGRAWDTPQRAPERSVISRIE